jgi:hypothetical protein
MTDSSAESNVNRPHRIKEYDDPHYHDEEPDLAGEDRGAPREQPRDKPKVNRRPPPPRRRYED